jgi:hypothetical protein
MLEQVLTFIRDLLLKNFRHDKVLVTDAFLQLDYRTSARAEQTPEGDQVAEATRQIAT